MRLAIRARFYRDLGRGEYRGRRQATIFGRPRVPDGTYTQYVGSSDKALVRPSVLRNYLLVFPGSFMTINADKMTTWDGATMSLDGNVRITFDVDAKAIFDKIVN